MIPPIILGMLLMLVLSALLAIGLAAGHRIRRPAKRSRLGAFTVAATALAASALVLGSGAPGASVRSPVIEASNAVRTSDGPTPALSAVAAGALPAVDPLPAVITPAQEAAAQSVVRIVGTAPDCQQTQAGSGFVAAPNRIITNSHVVAGVTAPVTETLSGQALPGTVVYFDPAVDLAVIAVSGLTAAPLALGVDLAPGASAVTEGYPFGGPFDSDPATVIDVGPLMLGIIGQPVTTRQIYTLDSDVQPGESGEPLLNDAGQVAGVVFARSTVIENLGYALAMEEVQPVAVQAPALDETVDSGSCVAG